MGETTEAMTQDSDFELRTMLHDWDEDTFDDRLKRYKYLAAIDKEEGPALDGLAPIYKFEAGRCYVQGNFVASIAMVGLTVDAFLRSILRSKCHESSYILRNGKHLDSLNSFQIFDEALAEGYITADEYKTLYHIRKDICEPYMQTKTNIINDPSIPLKRMFSENEGIHSFHLQEFKITDPWLVGGKSAEKEAREVLYLLAKLLPNILRHT